MHEPNITAPKTAPTLAERVAKIREGWTPEQCAEQDRINARELARINADMHEDRMWDEEGW